jgi:hypothetical protein
MDRSPARRVLTFGIRFEIADQDHLVDTPHPHHPFPTTHENQPNQPGRGDTVVRWTFERI